MLTMLQISAPTIPTAGIVIGVVVVVFIIIMIWASRYTKVPPNAVMVVTGGRGQWVRRLAVELPHSSLSSPACVMASR